MGAVNTVANRNPPIWATGSHGPFQWLTTGQHDLGTVLQLCPQAFLGKYVAVTSFDSGPLVPKDEELSLGWQTRNHIAYSPEIKSVEKLPYGYCGGFDEWYVFNASTDLGRLVEGNIFEAQLQSGHVAVFVNYGGFALHAPMMQDLLDLFWPQLERISPESYVADGDVLNFVSRDKDLFASVLQTLGRGSVLPS